MRDRRQQSLGIRVQRCVIQRIARGYLDDFAQIHHGHAGGEVTDHGKVVADKQVCQAKLFLKVFQKVNNLRLNGHIQCRNRLVTNNKLWFQRKRAGNTDTLALTTGKFVRVTVSKVACQTHCVH